MEESTPRVPNGTGAVAQSPVGDSAELSAIVGTPHLVASCHEVNLRHDFRDGGASIAAKLCLNSRGVRGHTRLAREGPLGAPIRIPRQVWMGLQASAAGQLDA